MAGCAAIPRAVGQTIIYVNATATGANDGSSWISGYTDLSDGLNAATPMNTPRDQVWVAAGEYKVSTANDTFLLKAGVHVYGGFEGTESGNPINVPADDPRQFDADGYLVHETILSGELGDPDDFSDNVEVLVTAPAGDSDFIFDGFTVTRAAGHGVYGPPDADGAYRNLRIVDNRAVEFDGLGDYDMGAGMFVVGCSPSIFRCR